MKTGMREIITFLIVALFTSMAVGFFWDNLKERKETVQADLFSLIAPSPHAILRINQPSSFSKYILSQPIEHTLFASVVPTIYLDIIQRHPTLETAQISFHPQGVIFYVQAGDKEVSEIIKETLQKRFHSFAPQKQTMHGQTFTYYPDAENNFFGCYHAHGIWVASYSQKLLEQVASLQFRMEKQKLHEQKKLLQNLDQHAPLNLLFPADSLDLHITLNDSTNWRIQNCWLGADLFTNENHLCYSGSIPHHPVSDSIYIQIGDTLALRIHQRFPSIIISNQTTIEEEQVFYSGCLTSQQPIK